MMTKNVLLTGATSGIGLAIGNALAKDGYRVFGMGRDTSKVSPVSEKFTLISCDVTDTASLESVLGNIQKEYGVACFDIVIFSAGVGYYGLHETLSPAKISELVRTNLESPMILCSRLLSPMKQRGSGHFLFLSSVTANGTNTYGCAYGATKAALSGFAGSLFEEVRKTGIKVTVLEPDMTKTSLYRNADFEADEAACLFPEDIAETVRFALSLPEHCNLTELTIQPQRHRIKKKR